MIAYPHFALSNIYLLNGYEEVQTSYGVAYKYEREDELEQFIRRVLLRKPEPLKGHDLRFLRRGLDLSQGAFGQMVDRDAQTIARWEKSADHLPKSVDMTIRARFGARFEPDMGLGELLSYVDGTAVPFPQKIVLALNAMGWGYADEAKTSYLGKKAFASARVVLPNTTGPIYTIIEKKTRLQPIVARDNDAPAEIDFWNSNVTLLKVSYDERSGLEPLTGIADFDFMHQGLTYEQSGFFRTKH